MKPKNCNQHVKKADSLMKEDDSDSEPDIPSRNIRSFKDPLKLKLRKSMLERSRNASELAKQRLKAKEDSLRTTVENSACSTSTHSSSTKKLLRLRIRKSMITRSKAAHCCSQLENVSAPIRKTAEVPEADVEPLTGRTEEFNNICAWIQISMQESSPLSVYISGAPGTGKSATVSLVLEKLKHSTTSLVVNCVSVKTQASLISTIMEAQGWSGKNNLQTLSQHIKKIAKPILLVLDEIDHLANKSNSILYTAFSWPSTISSKVILIGIANSIDLTERLLPKLKLGLPPKTLVFVPYQKETIVSILKNKMDKEKASFDSKAVELCARKVAAMSGDLRTALHIYNASKANKDVGEASGGVREVLGVLNSVYASPLARAKLPFQSRLILAICLKLSTIKKAMLTRNSLFSAYELACSNLKLPDLGFDERREAFSVLEDQSFISVSSDGKIRLMVDSKTAQTVVADNQLIEQVSRLKF